MKVGSLVTLSSAGKKLQMNTDLSLRGITYGMIMPDDEHGYTRVRWFTQSGEPCPYSGNAYGDARNHHRWELKFFKPHKGGQR